MWKATKQFLTTFLTSFVDEQANFNTLVRFNVRARNISTLLSICTRMIQRCTVYWAVIRIFRTKGTCNSFIDNTTLVTSITFLKISFEMLT